MKSQKILALTGAALLAFACGKALSSGHDSESHFLVSCDKSCAEGLSCICGVCTLLCMETSRCEGLSSAAACRAQTVADCSGDAAPIVACDVDCGADVDCGELSEEHVCRSGRCRAPHFTVAVSEDNDLDGPDDDPTGSPNGGDTGSPVLEPDPPNVPNPNTLPTFDPVNYAACCPGVTLEWSRFTLTPSCELDQLGVNATGCPPQLPPCGSPDIGPDEVAAALAHPDVVAALADGVARFGWNGIQNNFAWFPIQIDEALIEIGFDCVPVSGANAPEDCVAIPPGVVALQDLLLFLQGQQSSGGTCEPITACDTPIDPEPSCSALIDRFAYDATSGTCIQLPAGTGCFSNNLFASLLRCQNICMDF